MEERRKGKKKILVTLLDAHRWLPCGLWFRHTYINDTNISEEETCSKQRTFCLPSKFCTSDTVTVVACCVNVNAARIHVTFTFHSFSISTISFHRNITVPIKCLNTGNCGTMAKWHTSFIFTEIKESTPVWCKPGVIKEDSKKTLALLYNMEYNKSSRRSHTKENMVWIRSPDLDSEFRLFPKFNRDFLVKGYNCDKIFMKIRSFSAEI